MFNPTGDGEYRTITDLSEEQEIGRRVVKNNLFGDEDHERQKPEPPPVPPRPIVNPRLGRPPKQDAVDPQNLTEIRLRCLEMAVQLMCARVYGAREKDESWLGIQSRVLSATENLERYALTGEKGRLG